MRRTWIAAALCAFALGGALAAHVRLLNPSNGAGLAWTTPSHISIVIQSTGSDDVTDGSHFTALRNALDAWNHVPGSTVKLVENTSPTAEARTDWSADDIHLMIFDESDSSGYFPPGSGTVAITPVWFDSGGAITDADVLFNGSGYSFTTTAQGGHFDIEDVATHELGHFLGLDHSGWAGASMYPYVSPAVVEHRSLSRDDEHGLRNCYPAQSFATISGVVRRATDNSRVAGAHVVAVDASGRTSGGALASSQGNFTLRGLDAGTYTIYATPLDYPVNAANLSSGQTVQVDFRSTFGPTVVVANAQAASIGDLLVDSNSLLSLGRNNDRLPLRAIAGQNNAYFLRGAGLDSTCTLTSSDPNFTVVVDSWMNTMVAFEVAVPNGSANGHADLIVENGAGEIAILPSALEITPPSPTVTNLSTAIGSDAGGDALTISGTNFNAGARVVLGSHVYVDGQIGGCTVVDSQTITLTTAATSGGTYDVVVIDASGEEGRAASAFQFISIPIISTVFPHGGSALGGTVMVIDGGSFLPGLQVRIDGVVQPQVTVDSSTRLHVITEPGIVGGPYLVEVENPNNEIATSAFSYSASSDPAVLAVSPPVGKPSGGTSVTITGSNFDANSTVMFGADPATGLGGVAAASVNLVDANTLVATTPSHSAGTVAVEVVQANSGQAGVLDASFDYQSQSSSSGGGCAGSVSSGPFDPRDAAQFLAPFAFVLALFAIRALAAVRRIRAV